MRIKHGASGSAHVQVHAANNASGNAARAVQARLAHGRDAVHKLRLANDPHRFRPARLVHGPTFDEDRADDIVASIYVRQDFVEQVFVCGAVFAEFPQMMMWVADRQVRLQRFLYC